MCNSLCLAALSSWCKFLAKPCKNPGLIQSRQVAIFLFRKKKYESQRSLVRISSSGRAARQWRCCLPGILRWFPCHGNWTRHDTPPRSAGTPTLAAAVSRHLPLFWSTLLARWEKKKERSREGSRRRGRRRRRKRRRGRCVTDLWFQLFCCVRWGRAIRRGRNGRGEGKCSWVKVICRFFFPFHFFFSSRPQSRQQQKRKTAEGSIALKKENCIITAQVCVCARSWSPGHSYNRERDREEDMKTGKKSFIGRCSLKSSAVFCDCQRMLPVVQTLVSPPLLSCTSHSSGV